MIAQMSLYQMLLFFMIYSCLGWCVEVAYHAVTLGKVVNRGFLNGPICPVYGFGMLAILLVFNSIEADMANDHGIPLFIGGMLLTTAIELIAGWALDKLFHARWWDYSDKPFNLHGYICLEFSIIWGLGTVFIYRIVHPTIAVLSLDLIPTWLGWILIVLMYGTFAVDIAVTVATVRGLNRNLEELDELRRKLRIVSDSMSEHIADSTIRTTQRIEEGKLQAALAKAEIMDQAEISRRELQSQAAAARAEFDLRRQELQEALEGRGAGTQGTWEQKIASVSAANAERMQGLEAKRKELVEQYEAAKARIYAHPVFGAGRLAKAFPKAVHRDHRDLFEEFKRKLGA